MVRHREERQKSEGKEKQRGIFLDFSCPGTCNFFSDVVLFNLLVESAMAIGVYAVVRHPMYLSLLLISLTLVFLSQHWLNAVLGAIMAGLLYKNMCHEERGNIEKFGDEYRHYMEQVPRMNFVAGIIRLIRRKKKKIAA